MNNDFSGLRIQHVSFAFDTNQGPFFKDVNLSFQAGSLHFIRGRNGSGKTTLFRILHADIAAHESLVGTFVLDNNTYDVTENDFYYQYIMHVKHVVQNINSMLIFPFTVLQNLQLAQLSSYPWIEQLPALDDIPLLMYTFGIRPDMLVSALSGGQRQILAIFMMLQKKTRVLLLDEPTAALDPHNADQVMQCLERLAVNLDLVVLVISHDKELVESYAKSGYTEIVIDPDGTRSITTVYK